MSFPNASAAPSTLLADKKWRRRHSAWLLAPILGCGLLSFVGFLYIAVRAQTKKLWFGAAISGVGSAVVWLVMALSGDLKDTSGTAASGDTSVADTSSGWGSGVALAIWAALLVYAILLNRDYLRWRAGYTESRAWYNQPTENSTTGYGTGYPAAPSNQSHAHAPGFLGVSQSDYFTAPAQPSAPPVHQPPPQQSPQYAPPTVQSPAPRPTVSVDVNSATAETLVAKLGIDSSLALRVVAVRHERGGFSNLDDLAATAGLQPHEFLKFRNKVTFGASPPRATAPQPPTPPKDQPGGRIVDI